MTTIRSMSEVVPALAYRLSPAAIRALALRVRINTGVDITDPDPAHATNPTRIAAVCASLQSMGYPVGRTTPQRADAITTAHAGAGESTTAIEHLLGELHTQEPAAIVFFTSTGHDGRGVAKALRAAHPAAQTIGCTTAGEFTESQTGTGGIAAIALPASKVTRAASVVADFQHDIDHGIANALADLERQLQRKLSELDPTRHVGLVLIDGLHGVEERVNELLGHAAPFLSFIGGSAGDDLRFAETRVFVGERASSCGAALLILELTVPFTIVKTCSFKPTGTRFRVTRADVSERIVWELDAQPATEAYAAALGITPAELNSAVFAGSPVGLMINGEPWIRSPQRVAANGGLRFYCQIPNGIDVDLMRSTDLIPETTSALRNAARELPDGPAGGVLFNCILRRLEIDSRHQQDEFLDAVAVCPVCGFHTYGESYVGHINQTLTGLLIG